MQTCSQCNTQSPDTEISCVKCGVDLSIFSNTAVALSRYRNNSRIKNVRLITMHDSCPACTYLEGTYTKEEAPPLPVPGCSHHSGCRCFYEPSLEELFP